MQTTLFPQVQWRDRMTRYHLRHFASFLFLLIASLGIPNIIAAQNCNTNVLTNGDFSNGLASWTAGTGWERISGASYTENSADGPVDSRLSQTVSNFIVGANGIQILFQYFGSAAAGGINLDVEFGGVKYLTLSNPGTAGNAIPVTTYSGATVNTHYQPLAANATTIIQIHIPLSSLSVTSGTAISKALSFRHYGGSSGTASNYISEVVLSSDCIRSTALTLTQPKFTCSPGVSYLFQGISGSSIFTNDGQTSVYRLNLQDGTYSQAHGPLITTPNFNQANNFGYNPYDQYIWGHQSFTNNLIRVGSDWSVEYVSIPGLPARLYNAGDIDPNGIMYLFLGSTVDASLVIERVDLKTLTRLAPITLSPVDPVRNMIDLAYNPIDGNLYGIDRAHNLNRISLQTSSLGTVTIVGPTGISDAPSSFGAAFFDSNGTLFVSENSNAGSINNGRIFKVPNVAANSATAIFVSNGPVTFSNDGARCYMSPVISYTIKGKVWDDADGDVVKDVSELYVNTGTSNENGLWANLVDAAGNVISSEPVNLDGSYTLYAPVSATYKIILTSGQQIPGSLLSLSDLPEGWVNTGTNKSGTADPSNHTGVMQNVIVTNANLTDLNFGIEQIPTAKPESKTITQPTIGLKITLDGAGGNPPVPSGTDPEDGALGAGKTIVITTLPTNSILLYNGSAVVTGQIITDFNPTLLKIEFTTATVGAISTGFEFEYKDAAGIQSEPATYTLNWQSPLPVKLRTFTVQKGENNSASLQWTTTEETNSRKFEVEHSMNGKNWKVIATVAAKGESKQLTQYSYTHTNPSNGENLYRLRMEDLDGTFSYSRIISHNFEAALHVSVFPNPASVTIKVRLNGTTNEDDIQDLKIYDMNGKAILTTSKLTDGEVNVTQIPAGAYVVTVTSKNGTVHNTKIIIAK